MPITWLHISDFHIRAGDAYDRDVVLRALIKSGGAFHQQGRAPDLIFATGDVAQADQPGEYELDEVRVSFDGAVWGINDAGSLYQWDAASQSFHFVGNNQSVVVVGISTNVWATFVGNSDASLPATVSSWF